MGEVALEDAGYADVLDHVVHGGLARCAVEVVEDRGGEGVAIDVGGKLLETDRWLQGRSTS